MVAAPLVDDEIKEGQKLIAQLIRDGFDVTVACWIRFQVEETSGPWFFIVSKAVDQVGLQAAYRAVHAALHRIPAHERPWNSVTEIDIFQLLGVNDPLARDVLTLRDQYPSKLRFRRPGIANHTIEEIYIYPPLTNSAAEAERRGWLNIGTDAEPEFIVLDKVPLVTIIRDSAGPSKVLFVGGGKPRRALEGEEAQRFIAQFDAITKQME